MKIASGKTVVVVVVVVVVVIITSTATACILTFVIDKTFFNHPLPFSEHLIPKCNPKHTRLWTSSLRRTINTARHIKHDIHDDGWVTMRPRVWNNLDEL